jgi:hypothetical protein
VSGRGITSLIGIEAFVNVTGFLAYNNPLTPSGVVVPQNVLFLDLHNCQLTGTFPVPYSVVDLHVQNNQITTLDATNASGLYHVEAQNNLLTSVIWPFSIDLDYLDLSHNNLTTLAGVPSGYVNLAYNQLTAVPALQYTGSGITDLLLAHNAITSFGNEYTAIVQRMDLSYNPLTGGIQELPNVLQQLTITNTQLPCLPWIPWSLQTLYCTGSAFTCLPNLPPTLNTTPANFGFTPAVCGTASSCYIAPPRFKVKVLLQGPWDDQTQLMRDGLRQQGLLPTTEPYTALGAPPVGTSVPLTVSASVFSTTGPNAIVDWVLVELRGNSPSVLIDRQPALLQRDGDVVSTTGDSLIKFNQPRGDYHIAVRHRNHLSVLTWWAHTLWSGGLTELVDLRSQATIGFTGSTAIVNGRNMLWVGDATGDRSIKYTGVNNDRDPILQAIGGTTPTAVLHGVYRKEDVNLDGDVKYTGANNDRDPILQSIGGTTPTAVRNQIPTF